MTPEQQLDMFAINARGRARSNDPATSHEAAVMASAFSNVHIEIIAIVLKARGPSTQYEIAAASSGRLTHEQVHRRLPEMEKLGMVARTDNTRRGPSGRRCIVWAAL